MRVILLTLLLYMGCCGLEKSGKLANGYAFYYPHSMGAKQAAKVCLAIDQHLLPAVIEITFENKICEGTTCNPRTISQEFSCWKIIAPDQPKSDYSPTKLEVQIATNDNNIKFTEHNNVQIVNDNAVILETDRSTYNLGDLVKMRVVAFDFNLKPIMNYIISSLQIRSPYPSYAIINEWHNISTDLGLAHIEFQLAPDTPEGYWSITADDIYRGFEVKKYILPRFQTTIDGPDNIYNGSKSVSYRVCGTYSYGRNVKGVALLTVKARHGFQDDSVDFSQIKDLDGGCAKFELLTEDIGLNKDGVWSVDLTASVTEDGTEQLETTTKYVYINRSPYSYRWNYENAYMKLILPYEGEFSLEDVKIPLNNPVVELCYSIRPKEQKVCCNFTMDSYNRLEFTIPPIKDVPHDSMVEIQAKVLNYPLQYQPIQFLRIWYSKSKNAIKITSAEQNTVDCESKLEFTVLYNSRRFKKCQEVEFNYILTSRGAILNTGSVLRKPRKTVLNLDNYKNVIGKEKYDAGPILVDQFDLSLQLDKQVYTSAKLLVYYEYDDEVISDAIDINIKACTANQVDAKWSEKSLYPGEVGTLSIETDKGSVCSVSSIDKASTFLGSSTQISKDSVVNRFYRYYYGYELNCIPPKNETSETTTTAPFPDYIGYTYYSSLYDSFDAFRDSNIGIISNFRFIAKTCENYPAPVAETSIIPEMAMTGSGGATTESPTDSRGSTIRSFFPETWLWDLVPVPKGKTAIERKLPDSITNWEGNVVCMSKNEGIGISEKIEIQGFKPFFIDILLPYSIKRNKETLHLPIPIFNYLDHDLPIRLILETDKDIMLVDGQDKNTFTKCLGAGDSFTHNYRIKATSLGHLSITVFADTDPAYVKDCASDSVIRRKDAVRKSLLVEPEGFPSNLIKSALLCANDSTGVDNIIWDIVLPENVVADTVDGKVIINSDILGPMFQNLDNLIVVPTGCGEQTMATLTPNLYVLQYLIANNALTNELKEKILKNLEIGYQRMLTYAHNDGSFSAFGESDGQGSMFLTAFVIRTFRQMKQYTFIDDDVVNKAINWMVSHQLENGCFDPMLHLFHDMGLASAKNQTTALTSYVLISLLETNLQIDETVLANAKACIISDVTNDKYTLAISSYALGLLNLPQEVQQRLNKLMGLAETENGLLWWKQSEQSLSSNVEASSYVVISLLHQDPVANLGTVSLIVKWLQTQMNPSGAFYCTTDTVVGLDAISRYAILVNKKEPHVTIILTTKTDEKTIEITKRDRTRTDVLPLRVYPNQVKATIQGDGCVSIQTVVNYYLDTPTGIDDLHLDIDIKPVNEKLKCSLIELEPCVSYTALGQINMAIVEVNMPSGYAANEASLYELRTNTLDKGLKKFDLRRNQVILYLTQLGSDRVCLPFIIEENLIVENVANATVKFYDYYNPEVAISKSFNLGNCDSTTVSK